MATRRKVLAGLFAATACALVSACGGGSDAGAPPPAGVPAPAPSLKGHPILFVNPTGSATSTYLPGYDVSLTTFKDYIYRVVPALDVRELLFSSSATSYSVAHLSVFSSGSGVYLRRDGYQFEPIGTHSVASIDATAPAQQTSRLGWSVNRPVSDACSAVVGDYYYYRSSRTFDPLRGSQGGDFYRYHIPSKHEELVMPSASADNCYGRLLASKDALYDVKLDGGFASFTLYRRDLATAAPTAVQMFTESNPSAYDGYRFAVEAALFYIARRRKADGRLEIFRYNTSAANPALELIYANTPAVTDTIVGFDVDDGHIMLASTNGKVLMFDTGAGSEQVLDLGVHIAHIVQAFVSNGTASVSGVPVRLPAPARGREKVEAARRKRASRDPTARRPDGRTRSGP